MYLVLNLIKKQYHEVYIAFFSIYIFLNTKVSDLFSDLYDAGFLFNHR